MATYAEIQEQIAALKEQAEALLQAEKAGAIAQIRELMDAHGVTIEDLQRRSSQRVVAARYRDPATGKTWSGRGRSPRWLAAAEANGQRREQFLV